MNQFQGGEEESDDEEEWNAPDPSDPVASAIYAFFQKGWSKGKGKGAGKVSKGQGKGKSKCANCGKDGHSAAICRAPKAEPSQRPCFNCGEKGHLARNCPKPRQQQVNSAASGEMREPHILSHAKRSLSRTATPP